MLSQQQHERRIGGSSPFGSSPQCNNMNMPQRQALSALLGQETSLWNEQLAGWAAGEKRQATCFSQDNENKKHCSDSERHRLSASTVAENFRKRANDNDNDIAVAPKSDCKKAKIDSCEMVATSSPMAICTEEPAKKRDAATEVWDFIGVG
mmetsp:Transcript_21851/g.44902  ORF Transcript_21851/g.44902 Transcript_21851/m.44902 type:complete len:151 (+) Transcript_21851:135-587(+)